MVMGKSRDITINYNVPDTQTKDAIRALENKLEGTSRDVTWTRNEIRLLTEALRDLDQRTSGIKKLPDGRTRLGDAVITGFPSITVGEHNVAAGFLRKGDFKSAFEHSTLAIRAHEASQTNAAVKGGDLLPEGLAKVYHAGAVSAYNLQHYDLAYLWAKKAQDTEGNDERCHLLAATLFQLGKNVEALKVLDEVLRRNPNDEKCVALKKTIQSKTNP